MKTRIFVLGTDSSAKDELLDKMLKQTFSEQLGENGDVDYYSSVKDAAGAIRSAFPDVQSVIFLADPGNYGSLKKIIANAFGIRLAKNAAALERAERYAPELIRTDPQFDVTHVYLPENGKAFITSDGQYSGFASVRGEQSVIFLPYETERTCSLLAAQVIPFINSLYSVSVPTVYAEHVFAQPLHELLEREPVNVALALTKTADLFCDYVSTSPLLSKYITKTPRSEERGNMRPSEYVVNLSIAAAELQGVPYGIVMSNAYYMDENSKEHLTVFMAVTNEKQTTVREVKSYAWESSSDFMQRCCAELCKLLSDIISEDRGYNKMTTPDEPKKVQKYRTLIAIVGAAIILVCIVGGVIFTMNSYSMQDWMHNHFPAIFSQQTISDDEIAAAADEEKTEDAAAESMQETAEAVPENVTDTTETVDLSSVSEVEESASSGENAALG